MLASPRFAALVALALVSAACSDSPSGLTGPSFESVSVEASNFAVLANAGVTCTDGTIIGDVGTFIATGAITRTNCPITGTLHVGDGVATQAYNDFLNTYAVLAPQAGDVCTTLTGTLAGVTLAPGAYCFDAAATLTGVLTLDGPADGVWVLKIGTSGTGALTGTGFSVVMAGDGQASHVTWRVADAVTMTTSNIQGNILAGAGITLTGGSLHGNVSSKADVTITGTAVSLTAPSFTDTEATDTVVVDTVVVDTAVAGSNFAVLANAAVTCTGGTITGDVGTFLATPTGSVTLTSCPVTGTVHVGNGVATQAFNNFLSTYAALAPKPADVCTTLTGTLAGVTLSPGVYCFNAAATLTGVLTLNGPSDGTWVFQIGTSGTGALTGTSFSVVMADGGQASNVTWWVADAATMTTSAFQGNILAGAGITLTGGTFNGNAWSRADVTTTGVTMNGNTITLP
jgi:hypothetical protein